MRERFGVQWASLIVLIALTGQNSPAQQSQKDPSSAVSQIPPASARAEKNPVHAPTKISDAFAEAELQALDKVQKEDFTNSDILTSPSAAALDAAGVQATTADERRISSRMFYTYGDKWTNYRGLKLLKDFPTPLKKLRAVSSRINTCISAEKDELHQRRAELPTLCQRDPIYVPSSKLETAALEKEAETAARAAIASSGQNPTTRRPQDSGAVVSEIRVCQVAPDANTPEQRRYQQSPSPLKDKSALDGDPNESIVPVIASEKDGRDVAHSTSRGSPAVFAVRASSCNQ